MGKATKAVDNAYYKARMTSAAFNDRLSSREGAAELTCIERTRLARIELGSLTPYPEEVQLLADTYNAPELLNYHCTTDCPIGRQTMVKAGHKNIEQIALNAYISLQNALAIRDAIIDVAKDGIISDDEKPKLAEALRMLNDINKVATELSIFTKKLGTHECL